MILRDFNHMLKSRKIRSHSMCYMLCLGCKWVVILGFPPVVYIHLKIGADIRIYGVPTADELETGYNFIVQLRSLPRFAETTNQLSELNAMCIAAQ